MKIGDFLIEKGLITADQLAAALAAQQAEPDKKLGELLVAAGALSAAAFEAAFAEFRQG